MTTSVASALDWWARTKGGQTALIFDEDHLSYRDLRNWSGRAARRITGAGAAEGDRVAVLGGNNPDWAAAAFGVMKAACVLVPLNPRLVAAEIMPWRQDGRYS